MLKRKNIFIYIITTLMLLGCESENNSISNILNNSNKSISESLEVKDVESNSQNDIESYTKTSDENIEQDLEDNTSSKKRVNDNILMGSESLILLLDEDIEEDLEANTSNIDSANPTISNSDSIPIKERKIEQKATNWYISIVVENALKTMKTNNAKLGQLEVDSTIDKYSLKAFNPFGGSYVDVVFEDPNGVQSGKYKTSFHTYEEDVEDRWSFTVKTDINHINEDFVLSWIGIYVLNPYTDKQNRKRYKEYRSITNPIMQYMKLIDSETQEEIPAITNNKIQKYSFNMGGSKSRKFEWVLKSEKVDIKVKQKKMLVSKSKVIVKETNECKNNNIKVQNEFFDLSQPPMIEELE